MPTSFGWVRRGGDLRTVSGPKGSSTKQDPLGAAGVPARGFSYPGIEIKMKRLRDLIQTPLLQKIGAGLLAVLGISLIVLSLHKNITLVINGESQEITTYSLTVRGFLKEQALDISGDDRVFPPPGRLLRSQETIYLSPASQVEIHADGDVLTLTTAERRPENVLLQAGVLLFPKDRLLVDGKPSGRLSPGKDHLLEVLRGTPITLRDENGVQEFISDGDTLADAFENQGIEIFPADQLSRALDTPLDGTPITVELVRAEPLQVRLADRSITIHTTAETVGAALAQGGIALQGLDYSIPAENEPVPDNRQVQIVRVREEVLLNQEKIQFTSEYQPADDLELDQLSILSGGEFGLSAQRIRVTYENDQETTREVEKEWILKEPSPRIIGYGTQIELRTANTPDGQITYWRKITAYATSYNENCEGCKTYTASGADLKQGVIAVRLAWYRYMKGMKVYIPGYGFASIEDVGGGVPWSYNWVDLGYKAKNYVPWSQNVEVYFLAPAPPPENIMYVLN
jgi:uncharacterized protein YabE (DUF348 family)